MNYIEALSQLKGDIDRKTDFDELVKYCATLPASILDWGEDEAYQYLNDMPVDFFERAELGIRENSKNLYCMLKKISEGVPVEAVANSLEDYETLGLNDAELATLRSIAGNEAKIALDVGDKLATLTEIKALFDEIKSKGVDPFGLFVLYRCTNEEVRVAEAFKKFYLRDLREALTETEPEEAFGELTFSSFDRLKTIATAMKMGAAEAAARHTADSFSNASGGRRNKRIRTGDTFTTKCDDADKSSRIIGTLIELGDWSGRKNECSILLDPRLSLM